MLKHFAVLLLSSALAVACTTTPKEFSALRIDAKSRESAESSYKAMMSARSEREQQKLALAVVVLNMEGVNSVYEVVRDPELKAPSVGRIKDKVAGMTADEIIALAARTSSVRIEVPGQ